MSNQQVFGKGETDIQISIDDKTYVGKHQDSDGIINRLKNILDSYDRDSRITRADHLVLRLHALAELYENEKLIESNVIPDMLIGWLRKEGIYGVRFQPGREEGKPIMMDQINKEGHSQGIFAPYLEVLDAIKSGGKVQWQRV